MNSNDIFGIMEQKGEQFSIERLIIGLLLLVPGVILFLYIQLQPTLNTLAISQTNYSLLREPDFVGMENFSRLLEDPVYGQAVGYTVLTTVVRLFIVALVPPVVGTLAGGQAFPGRAVNRLLLSALGILISPIALGALYIGLLSPVWGQQPSPLTVSPNLLLNSPNGARTSLLLVDSLITVAIAAVVGGAAFMGVMRGRDKSPSSTQAGIGVWLLGIVLAVASAPHTFTLPYVLTNGGPANSTQTIGLYLFNHAYRNFNFGYASAQAVMIILPLVFLGLVAGGIIWLFRLRLTFTPPAPRAEAAGLLNILSVPLILLIGLPSLGLFIWGIWLTISAGGFERLNEILDTGRVLANTVSGPWLAIWLVQIPISYLLCLALGFVRPVNRLVSNLIFLVFMALAFIPAEALSMSWYETLRDLGALNTSTGVAFAYTVNLFSLLVFKLFFDGAYERYHIARESGQTATDAFLNTTFLPSLGIVLVVGAVLSFASAQSLMWPLIVVNTPELYGFPTQLLMVRSDFGTQFPLLTGVAVTFIGVLGVIFLPVFALLNILVVDRLAILAGLPVKTGAASSNAL